jgi:hypothetical protein
MLKRKFVGVVKTSEVIEKLNNSWVMEESYVCGVIGICENEVKFTEDRGCRYQNGTKVEFTLFESLNGEYFAENLIAI